MPRRKRRDISLQERSDNKRTWLERKRKKREGEYVPTPIPDDIKKKSLKLWGPYCFFCGYAPEKGEHLEFDHWTPEALGGEMTAENIIPVGPRHHDAIGIKRSRNPMFLLDAMFYEIRRMPELENDPAFSSLYTADTQLK